MRNDFALKRGLADVRARAIQLLNQLASEFPSAISFAHGYPLDSFLDVDRHLDAIAIFVDEAARRLHRRPEQVRRDLGQYAFANGLVTELIATHLAKDEGIQADPRDIIVTVGAQEALAVLLAALFEPERDILLVGEPTYFGVTGLAQLLGVRALPIPASDTGLEPASVEEAIIKASREGRVRAIYDVPDFNNPLGTSLPVDARRALLEICQRYGVFFLEDNPYGLFAYTDDRVPTLKALDQDGSVLYVGSFSKVLCPGLRVGYLVADRRAVAGREPLVSTLSRVKSLFTVETAPLMQAIAGGMLLRTGGSLAPIVEPKRAQYRANRDAMIAALTECFADLDGGVSWTVPAGGFFLPMTLPFDFGTSELRRLAVEHGVIVCPMDFFCSDGSRSRQIRLSFSHAAQDQIRCGVERLATFVRHEMLESTTNHVRRIKEERL